MDIKKLEIIQKEVEEIINKNDIVFLGEHSILGENPNLSIKPQSNEIKICFLHTEGKTHLINRQLGKNTPFHKLYGYYVHCTPISDVILPKEWKERLTNIQLNDTACYCINIHDLAISKIMTNKENDNQFVKTLFEKNLINPEILKILATDLQKPIEPTNNKETLHQTIQEIRKKSEKTPYSYSNPSPILIKSKQP